MTQTIENLTVEIPDTLHDYIQVNLSKVEVNLDFENEEGHGFHNVENINVTYHIDSITVNDENIDHTLTKDQVLEVENAIINSDG